LKEECGEGMETWLTGRVPIGHHEYTLPDGKQTQVYFLKSFIVQGNVKPDGEEVVDYAWVTEHELDSYLSPELLELVKKMI
jgi:large subunit ribosomal protein L46